ncbi:MAG: hypothetical protein P8Z74_04480 [Acidobacteriota bacterium]
MAVGTLLVIFVGVTALSIVLEGIFVWRTLRSANRAVDRISSLSKGLEQDAREVLTQFQDVATGLEQVKTAFDNLGTRAAEVSQMMEARANDLERFVERLVEVGNRQAEKVDEVVTDTVVIQQDVLKPIVEIASVIRGLKTGLDYLFSRKSSTSTHSADYTDEELFI